MARHSRTNTDIKPIREIDIENASKDELIEYLCQTIHYEVEKGEDADCDLIRECSDWLSELTADVILFTPEELEARLEAIKSGKDSRHAHTHKPYLHHPIAKRKVFARVTILVASLVLLSFLSLSALAMHAGYDSTWAYISMNVGKMFGLNAGETINEEHITVIKNNKVVKYNNMNELLTAESLKILYPHVLPNEIKVTELRYINKGDNKYTLRFALSSDLYAFVVSNYYSTDITQLSVLDLHTVNGLDYYVTQKENVVYFALFQNSGYEYTIKAPNYEDLLIIINNIRG